MVIAALVTFAVLLIAWLLAPSEPVLAVVQPSEPALAEAA